MELVEIGRFKPADGMMEDWAVLGNPAAAPDGVAVTLARRDDLSAQGVITDALDDRHVEVAAISFPSASARVFPRSPLSGTGLVICSGFLKSDRAYREAAMLGADSGIVYDDALSGPPPRFAGDVDSAFARSQSGVARAYEMYHRAGHSILYHSADYAPGSSGGGLFGARSGCLLGIIPWGTTVVSRKMRYAGFGQAFRIDAICRQSQQMARFDGCRALIGPPEGTNERR